MRGRHARAQQLMGSRGSVVEVTFAGVGAAWVNSQHGKEGIHATCWLAVSEPARAAEQLSLRKQLSMREQLSMLLQPHNKELLPRRCSVTISPDVQSDVTAVHSSVKVTERCEPTVTRFVISRVQPPTNNGCCRSAADGPLSPLLSPLLPPTFYLVVKPVS
ncbi:hypothetical protein EYF80_007902 [Liparis tanakae]|uniref:Uncharacterized protein n=1 Tax=Liparis tanakae TaxID=230148 RepID=A0A4Z2IWY1_9TELE|nr:hypothetical protein EYF80_007902 [Liparis tanakae]